MKAFLIRLGRFAVLLAAFGVLSRAVNHLAWPAHRPDFAGPTPVLIMGDSHVRFGIDPSRIPGSRNVAHDAEPLLASFYKLEALLEWVPGIEVVVLGFGPHNLAAFNDRKFADPEFSNEMIRRYYGIVPWRHIAPAPVSRPAMLTGEVRALWTPNFHLMGDLVARLRGGGRAEHPYLGRFEGVDESILTQARLDVIVDRHFSVEASRSVVSTIQEEYLRRIVELATVRGVRLVLVSTPTHPWYRALVPGDLAARYGAVWTELTSIPGVSGLDLSDLDLDESLYKDFDHVNRTGAARVASALADHLGLTRFVPDSTR